MKMIRGLAYTAVVLTLSACASGPSQEERLAQILALTPEHFANTAAVSDDELDVTATITTQPGFEYRTGLLNWLWSDEFLRAHVDKKTGAVTFQVYQMINYDGDWRFYQTVNYETPDGPKQDSLTVISRDVTSCSSDGCSHSEHFAWSVDEALLRTIADAYSPGVSAAWKYKYGARAAEDWQGGILPAEVVGILRRVDKYRSDHGLPSPST